MFVSVGTVQSFQQIRGYKQHQYSIQPHPFLIIIDRFDYYELLGLFLVILVIKNYFNYHQIFC